MIASFFFKWDVSYACAPGDKISTGKYIAPFLCSIVAEIFVVDDQ